MPTTAHIQTIPRLSPLGAWRGSGFSKTGELTNDGTMSRSRVWPWGSHFTWVRKGGCWERLMGQE
eukprot:2932965-Rhodomonas_salina.1